MAELTANMNVRIEALRSGLPGLYEIAEGVGRIVGKAPPQGGYDLSSAVVMICNHGTTDQIAAAIGLLRGWTFEPAAA